MEIVFKRVSEEAYKDIAPYIDAMLPYIKFLGNLYVTDINGHHYVLSEEGNKITIVDNFNGVLNTFCLEFDEAGRVSKYIDDLCEYELSFEEEGNIRGVRSTDKITNVVNQIVYFPAVDNDPTVNVDFYQYFPESTSSAIFNYDVTRRDNTIDAALAYMEYNYPNKIVLNQLVFFLNVFSYEREQIFFEDERRNMYAKAKFRFREKLFPEFNKRYSKDKVIYTLEDMGYKVKVPAKMGGLLSGRDDDLNQMQLLALEYKRQMRDK